MTLAYTGLVDAVELGLRDSSNTYWGTSEIDDRVKEALRTVARYKNHLVRVTYQIESRYGSETAGTSDTLTDATKDQFLSTDTGKRVFNSTDRTWADVLSYTDAETLGISHDIMDSGENYYLYNKGCSNNKQINVEDITDYVGKNHGVYRLEYPIGKERNIDYVDGDIVQIGMDVEPDDSDPNNTDREVDIYVWFNKRHKLSQLTDFAGAVNNAGGYSKGDTSMAINGLQSSGTIEEDQEFTLANRDQVYTVTAAATISSNAATISFYPGLDADVANAVVVTFIQSTLDDELEEILIDYVIGKCLMDEANLHLPQISVAGVETYKRYLESAGFRYNQALARLRRLAESEPSKILTRF